MRRKTARAGVQTEDCTFIGTVAGGFKKEGIALETVTVVADLHGDFPNLRPKCPFIWEPGAGNQRHAGSHVRQVGRHFHA